jgi:hypothetical protein
MDIWRETVQDMDIIEVLYIARYTRLYFMKHFSFKILKLKLLNSAELK